MKGRAVLTKQTRKGKTSDSWRGEEKEEERKGARGSEGERRSQTPVFFHFYPLKVKYFGGGEEEREMGAAVVKYTGR